MVKKTVKLSIWGNDYEVNFPNVGNFLDIQTIKAKLTDGQFDTFKKFERDGLYAIIFCETIATFNVMIPKLKEDLNVPGLLSLDLDKIIELAYIYKDQYVPFYEGIMEEISNPKKEENANTTSKETVNA